MNATLLGQKPTAKHTVLLMRHLISTFEIFTSDLVCDEKGVAWVWQKAESNSDRSHKQHTSRMFYSLRHWLFRNTRVFCSAVYRSQALVAGVNVNSLWQQIGLFVLRVNTLCFFLELLDGEI